MILKKLKNHSGFSLIEMLAAIGILVILVVGMDSGIKAGMRAYNDAVFESNSATLAGILNTAVGDVLRYSEDIKVNNGLLDKDGKELPVSEAEFVFSNYEYGILNGYFSVQPVTADSAMVLQVKDLDNHAPRPLVNTGAYPELEIDNFVVHFFKPDDATAAPENYFHIEYDIRDTVKTDHTNHISHTVRLLNPKF